MKVLLDLKPLQGTNANHGIGRVTYELSKRLIQKLESPMALLSNINSKKGIQIQDEYKALNPKIKFHLIEVDEFKNYFELYQLHKDNHLFIAYELLLEWKISQIQPDIFLTFSFFEMDHPTSMGKLQNKWVNFVIAYDLIPYLFKDYYLTHEPYKTWYLYKLQEFTKADLFFSISEHTKKDLIEHLKIPEEKIKVIPLGTDDKFKPLKGEDFQKSKLKLKGLGIINDFILYVPSGYDLRKNIDCLIKAYSILPKELREKYQLVIASKIDEINLKNLKSYAKKMMVENDIVFTGYVSEDELVILYNVCSLFVHPSFYEGFGLPVLEAMKCGAPVLVSNNSALKELVQIDDALFDPYKPEEIAEKIRVALTNEKIRSILKDNSKRQSQKYFWDKAIEIILENIKEQEYGKFQI